MRNEIESVEWDNDGIVITKRERIEMPDTDRINDARKKLRTELEEIVRQVKSLKARAEEVKDLLNKLEEKAGSIDPAPVESQPSPVE